MEIKRFLPRCARANAAIAQKFGKMNLFQGRADVTNAWISGKISVPQWRADISIACISSIINMPQGRADNIRPYNRQTNVSHKPKLDRGDCFTSRCRGG